jgi:hypothetical protein
MRALAILAALALLSGGAVTTPVAAQDRAENKRLSTPFRGYKIRRGSFPPRAANVRPPRPDRRDRAFTVYDDRPNFYPEDGSDGYRPGYGYRKGSFGYKRNNRR